MSKENWISTSDNFTLNFESVLWINVINNPASIGIRSRCSHESNLFSRNWSTNCWRMFKTMESKLLSEQIIIRSNSNFLTVSNVFVISEHIWSIFSLQAEYWSGHWSWILTNTCGSYLISFFNIWNFITNINAHPSLSVSVLNHNTVTPSDVSIIRKWPWDLLITLLICTYSFREW